MMKSLYLFLFTIGLAGLAFAGVVPGIIPLNTVLVSGFIFIGGCIIGVIEILDRHLGNR